MKQFSNISRILITRILPPFVSLFALLRPLLAERGEIQPLLPLETLTTLLMVASIFLLATPLVDLPGMVRTAIVIGISILPALGVILGGWLFQKFKISATLLWILPFLVDGIVAISLHSPIAAVMDVCMILLYGMVLITSNAIPEKT